MNQLGPADDLKIPVLTSIQNNGPEFPADANPEPINCVDRKTDRSSIENLPTREAD